MPATNRLSANIDGQEFSLSANQTPKVARITGNFSVTSWTS